MDGLDGLDGLEVGEMSVGRRAYKLKGDVSRMRLPLYFCLVEQRCAERRPTHPISALFVLTILGAPLVFQRHCKASLPSTIFYFVSDVLFVLPVREGWRMSRCRPHRNCPSET